MPETENQSDVAALTVQLLSAYLVNNTLPATDLAELIRTTKAALTQETVTSSAEPEAEVFTPAVSVRKSLASADHIISLIDGKPYKTLKRHLSTHGLTPDTYRERYGLPSSYPMTAPNFTAMRRKIAEKIGLGNRKAVDVGETEPSAPVSDAAAEIPVSAPVPASAASKPKVPKTPARKPKARSVAETVSTAVEPEAAQPVVESPPAVSVETQVPAKTAAATPKPKKAPVKRMARSPKRSVAVDAPSPEPKKSAEQPADTAPVSNRPKRRGKLGLFGKDAAEADTVKSPSAANSADEAAKPRRKRAATKVS